MPYYQQIWQYLEGDPSTAAWLDGTANSTVAADPAYSAEKLGTPPAIDSMPRAYPNCLEYDNPSGQTEQRCSIDMIPYVNDFDAASSAVLAANCGNL